MKYIFIFLLLLSTSVWAQDAYTDSLNTALKLARDDSSRSLLLAEIAKNYYYSRPDTALILAQNGIALAREAGYPKGVAEGLNVLCRIFALTGNYPQSLENGLEALKIFERIDDKIGIISTEINIGNVYNEIGDLRTSLEYFFKAKAIAEAVQDTRGLAIILLNAGDSYEKLNMLDSARFYTEQAKQLTDRYNFIDFRSLALNNLGNIYSKMDKKPIAMDYYRQSIHEFKLLNDFDGICESTIGLARIFLRLGRSDSALFYAHKSLFAAREGGFTNRLLNASIFLSNKYKAMGNIDSAFHYQELTIAAKDSLFNQEKSKQVQTLRFEEVRRVQEKEALAREAAFERKKNIQMAGIGAFIPVFFGILLFVSRKRVSPKTIEFFGLLGLLLLFEFITLYMHPRIEEFTHHTPVLTLLILVAMAALLVPSHHKLEHWVKEKLAHRKHPEEQVKPERDVVIEEKP